MKIFLAAPFTDKINLSTGQTEEIFTLQIKKIINYLRKAGHEIICAHEREQWGKDLDPPDEALDLDFQGIFNADIVVAILGNPISPGVQMELGAALVTKTPIICLYKEKSFIPYLVKGMHRLTRTAYIEYTSLDTIKDEIVDRLKTIAE